MEQAKSEYSYFSEEASQFLQPPTSPFQNKRTKSGMTEQDVVPDTIPENFNSLEDMKLLDTQDNQDAGSDWSEQMREANVKSGFISNKQEDQPE